MKELSRVTITLPPSSLRASSSSRRSCRAPERVSACSSRSRATSTRHSSRLRGGSFHSFTAPTLVRSNLYQPAARPQVDNPGPAELVLGAPGLMDVPAHRERGVLDLDRLENRLAAQVVARARGIAVPLGRGVDDEHGALRAGGEALGRLVLVEVEAPVPGSDRDPGAEPEELRPVDLGLLPVEHGRGVPALAGCPQSVLGLVVAGHEHGRDRDRTERADRLLEALVDRGEIAGG